VLLGACDVAGVIECNERDVWDSKELCALIVFALFTEARPFSFHPFIRGK
jgi:hypothetical protein